MSQHRVQKNTDYKLGRLAQRQAFVLKKGHLRKLIPLPCSVLHCRMQISKVSPAGYIVGQRADSGAAFLEFALNPKVQGDGLRTLPVAYIGKYGIGLLPFIEYDEFFHNL